MRIDPLGIPNPSLNADTKQLNNLSINPSYRNDSLSLSLDSSKINLNLFKRDLAKVVSENNEINLPADTTLHLTSINNKPINVRFFSSGGLETSVSPMMQSTKPGTMVTPEQMLAAHITESYSQDEHDIVSKLTSSLHTLYQVSKGLLPLEKLNTDSTDLIKRSMPIGETLEMIGIDIDKSFILNGVKYRLINQKVLEEIK